MLKESIVCVVILVLIFGINFYLQEYTKDSVEEMTESLEELKQGLLNENKEEIDSKKESIAEKWEEINHNMSFYIEHDELEKVKTDLVALQGYIEVGEYDTGVNELNKTVFVLEHIAEKYDFSLVNVF